MSMRNYVIAAFALGALLAACRREAVQTAPPTAVAVAAPADTLAQPVPIENYVVVSAGLISGAQPVGAADFDALANAGVRTIISVDGATPDAASARQRGMRYVHLPIGYDGIKPEQRVELARAFRDLPKPVYIHCHHGKHRGPAAAAVAAIGAGRLDCTAGRSLLEHVGTSPQYPGLWAAVAESQTLNDVTLATARADFPERAPVGDFVAAMAAVDRAFDHLKLIQQAGWQTPGDHPDLVPQAEAARLAELLRHLPPDPYVQGQPADFRAQLVAAGAHAAALEKAMTAAAAEDRAAAWDALAKSCKRCHMTYRD